MTQKQFVIGLIEEELDRDEELLHQQEPPQADTEEEQVEAPVEGVVPEDDLGDERAEYEPQQEDGQALQSAMTASGYTQEQGKAAEVLFVLALWEQAHEPGFVDKLVGCFAEEQTDEQLIEAVNAAFGTNLTAEEFTIIMTYVNNQIVEIARSQLGNVGGRPYWSWYGFGSRVEWCACFVSCVRKRWASPTLPVRLHRQRRVSQVFQLLCRGKLV